MHLTRTAAIAGWCLLTALLAACGGNPSTTDASGDASPSAAASSTSSEAPSPRPSSTKRGDGPATPGTVIVARDSAFGPILFDRTGQAIYLFDVETSTKPGCYGPCAEAWPPVLTKEPPRAAGGARQGLLGTTERRDGTRQVTYRGHPLYFYAHEAKNVVECHDVFLNGGTWYALQPDGRRAP